MTAASGSHRPRPPARWGGAGVLRWTGQVLMWLVILSVAAVLTVGIVIPRLGGATPYTILSGSMRPDLPPGTLVVVRSVRPETIAVGDVITFQLRSGDPTLVTHRVVAQGLDQRGEPVFRTQGDANDAPDEAWTLPVQIKGKRWYSVPYLGYVNSLVDGWQRHVATEVAAVLLLVYSAYMFTGAARGHRSGRAHARVSQDG